LVGGISHRIADQTSRRTASQSTAQSIDGGDHEPFGAIWSRHDANAARAACHRRTFASPSMIKRPVLGSVVG